MDSKYLMKHPKDQLFYKALAFMMGTLGLNSQYWEWFDLPKNLVYRLQRILMITAVPFVALSEVVYLLLNYSKHEFQSLSMIFAILLVTFIVIVKVSISQTKDYKRVMEDFTEKIHLCRFYATDRDSYVKKTLLAAEKLVRWSSFYYMIFCYTCYAGFEIVPIVHNFQNNESMYNITARLEIMVHVWLPFDYEFNFTNWIIIQALMVYCGFMAISVVAMFDIANLIFIYHMTGHIKILKHRIKTSFGDDLTEEEMKRNLIDISQYYTFIKQTLKHVEAAFGLNVACIYLHNLIGGGLFIYQLSTSGTDTGTIFTYGLSIPLYMGILVIISFALENIRVTATDIPDLVYSLNWEKMSVSNKKMFQMVLCQVQPTLEFVAAFNIKTGVQPAVSIIKTAFSFYVMIKSRM